MKTQSFLYKPFSAGIFWGLAGGISLILFTFISNRGLVQVIPYPIILLCAILFLKYSDSSKGIFKKMFIAGFLSFIIMSIIHLIYILGFENATYTFNLNKELFTLAIIIATGFTSSLVLSFIAKPVNQRIA